MKRICMVLLLLCFLTGCSRYEKSKPINSEKANNSSGDNQTTSAEPKQTADVNLQKILEDIKKQESTPVGAIGLGTPQSHLSKVLEGELGKITIDADVYTPDAPLYHYNIDAHKYDIEKLKELFFDGKTPNRKDDEIYKTYELTENSIYYHLDTERDGIDFLYYLQAKNPTVDKEFYNKVSVESAAKVCKELLAKLDIDTSEYYIYKKKEDLSGLPAYEFTFYSNREGVRVSDKSYDMMKTSPFPTSGDSIILQHNQYGISRVEVSMYRDVTKTGEVYQLDKLISVEEATKFLQEEMESWGFDYDETFHMVSLVYAPTQEKGSSKIDGIYSVFWEFSPEPSSDQVDRYLVNAETGRVFKA